MSDQMPTPGPAWATMPPEFWRVAYMVLAIFAMMVVLVLMGCWAVLSGRVEINGPALAAISGLVGTIVGYGFAMGSTVLSTIYGGSISGQHAQRTVNATGSTTINESPTETQ